MLAELLQRVALTFVKINLPLLFLSQEHFSVMHLNNHPLLVLVLHL
jgi:hypothetical protein